MKNKSMLFAFILFTALGLYSCNDNRQILSYQQTIDSLIQVNNILKKEIVELKTERLIDSLSQINNPIQDKEAAIDAIKYELKMYSPNCEYSEINAVQLTDGTFDVIVTILYKLDYEKRETFAYYNVSVYKGGSYRINKKWGALPTL